MTYDVGRESILSTQDKIKAVFDQTVDKTLHKSTQFQCFFKVEKFKQRKVCGDSISSTRTQLLQSLRDEWVACGR